MSDSVMFAMAAGAIYSSLWVIPLGRTWGFLAFLCMCLTAVAKLR